MSTQMIVILLVVLMLVPAGYSYCRPGAPGECGPGYGAYLPGLLVTMLLVVLLMRLL